MVFGCLLNRWEASPSSPFSRVLSGRGLNGSQDLSLIIVVTLISFDFSSDFPSIKVCLENLEGGSDEDERMSSPRVLVALALAAAAICCLPSSNALSVGGEGEQDSRVGKVSLRLAREGVMNLKGGLFKKRGSKEYEFDAEDEAGRLRRASPLWICFCIRVRSSSRVAHIPCDDLPT
jgi:hypothetical protein